MSGNVRRVCVEEFLALCGMAGPKAAVPPLLPDSGTAGPLLPLPRRPSIAVVDMRSPGEYAQGHIPGAMSLPLFSDEERAAVGTLYKQEGRDPAFLLGLEYAGKRLPFLGRCLLEFAGPERTLALYCSRGGMRSGSVAGLCGTLGLRCIVLERGYKAYRRYVLDAFERPWPLRVLGGATGSGKTEVLGHAARLGGQVIDLEALARHRGSAFGALPGAPQPTCEQFENRLALALSQCDTTSPIWLEDECENLGRVNVPRVFFTLLRAAPLVVLESSDESRMARVLAEYASMPREQMAGCLDRIKKRLGGLEHKRAHACLAEGDMPGLARILFAYYDRAYCKQLQDRNLVKTVRCDNPLRAAEELLRKS